MMPIFLILERSSCDLVVRVLASIPLASLVYRYCRIRSRILANLYTFCNALIISNIINQIYLNLFIILYCKLTNYIYNIRPIVQVTLINQQLPWKLIRLLPFCIHVPVGSLCLVSFLLASEGLAILSNNPHLHLVRTATDKNPYQMHIDLAYNISIVMLLGFALRKMSKFMDIKITPTHKESGDNN